MKVPNVMQTFLSQSASRKHVILSLLLFMASCSSTSRTQTAQENRANGNQQATTTQTVVTQTSETKPDQQNSSANNQENAPASNQDRGILIDYRREQSETNAAHLSQQRQQEILRAVYGAKATQDNLAINSTAQGAFTRAGAKETVYLIQPGGPAAIDPSSLKKITLAILGEDNRLVAKISTSDHNFIVGHTDVNSDGINELLLEGGFYNMGTLLNWVELVELTGGRLHVIKDFGKISENPCDGDNEKDAIAGVISYAPTAGQAWPDFKVDFYKAHCPPENQKLDPQKFRPAPNAKPE